MRAKSTRLVLGLGLLFWVASFAFALALGASDQADFAIIQELRLPRALLASAVGMGLAVSGAALQALFSNPLCEPYTLGISSGSALGAVLGISLGIEWSYGGLAVPSFVGAIAFAGALYLISLRAGSTGTNLLLAGVMLGFLGSSLVSVWMALVDANGLQAAIFWLLGDLSRARLTGALISLSLVIALSFLLWRYWRELDALLMGEEGAAALGVSVRGSRLKVVIITSFLVGLCVSGAGMIGFIGLITPHLIRRFSGSLHRSLIPLAAIWGAGALTFADTLARVVARPYELPVGVITALIGAPLFLLIMLRRQGRVE